jgi:hypothetical protein
MERPLLSRTVFPPRICHARNQPLSIRVNQIEQIRPAVVDLSVQCVSAIVNALLNKGKRPNIFMACDCKPCNKDAMTSEQHLTEDQ